MVRKNNGHGLVELQSVFQVMHGNKFDLNKMEQCPLNEDAIAFVGRSGEGSGIAAFVRKRIDADPFPAGLITVALGGAILASFVQPRPFYTAQNVDVLQPIEAMTLDMKLYYCLCITANRFRYSTFGREANRTLHLMLVPSREACPAWVGGATTKAIADVNRDLVAAIGE